jgi:hypothetical protein
MSVQDVEDEPRREDEERGESQGDGPEVVRDVADDGGTDQYAYRHTYEPCRREPPPRAANVQPEHERGREPAAEDAQQVAQCVSTPTTTNTTSAAASHAASRLTGAG